LHLGQCIFDKGCLRRLASWTSSGVSSSELKRFPQFKQDHVIDRGIASSLNNVIIELTSNRRHKRRVQVRRIFYDRSAGFTASAKVGSERLRHVLT